ncbi:MAG: hypothetical protein OXH75_10085 [Acidobacteria bacterium]|nr:hypothetical protein [Acidobacteriota bacterium]
MTTRTLLAAALAAAALAPQIATAAGQRSPAGRPEPQVEVVQTVGCVEQRISQETTWWLTRAVEPATTDARVFNEVEVEEARENTSGDHAFQLVGVADFLTAEGLLRFGQRAIFTNPEQINATGELRAGRTVLVKGLLIEADDVSRINLLSVVGLADTCGQG